MKSLNLIGLKMTIMGAALTVCGLASPLCFYGGLALMFASLFVGDKIETEEKKKHDAN